MLDQVLMQVERLLDVIVSRRRKAGGDALGEIQMRTAAALAGVTNRNAGRGAMAGCDMRANLLTEKHTGPLEFLWGLVTQVIASHGGWRSGIPSNVHPFELQPTRNV
jgi:hypothetical protein